MTIPDSTQLYDNVDTTEWISAPGYIRQRHRYRGQRESDKLNAEISAFLFDVHRLYDRAQSLDDAALSKLEILLEGGSVAATYILDPDDVNDALRFVVIPGLLPVATRVERLKSRVQALPSL